MKYIFLLITALFSQSVTASDMVTDSSGKAKPFKSLTHLIDQYAENEVAKGNIHSLAVAIYRDGSVYHNYYGEIDKGAQNKPDDITLYEIASISKVFAGSLAARAVLEGKIKLEDDIRTFLPGEYPNLEFENTPISIRNLLTHTLGFKTKNPVKLEAVNRKIQEGYYENRPFDYGTSDFLEELKSVELDKKPGTYYEYNSVGSELVAYILEQVYNRKYRDLLQDFLNELKMENTYLQEYQNHKKYLINSYTDSGKLAPADKNPLWGGGYGMLTTLPDLIKFMKFQLESDNPLIKESRRILYEDDGDNVMGYLWQDMGTGKEEGFYYSKTGDSYGVRSGLLICPDSNYGQIVIINNKSDAAHDDWETLFNKIETDLIKFPRINLKSIVKAQFLDDLEAAKQQFNVLSGREELYFNNNLEYALNSLGYDLMYADKKVNEAINIFEFAIKEFPENANLFDSLGEAYFINEEYDNSLLNYKKSLELNPGNENAKKYISEISKLKAN